MTVALGTRRVATREANDFYRTPPACTKALLGVEYFCGGIWEPACGDGAISNVLRDAGHSVFSTDLIDRGYGESGFDFLKQNDLAAPTIITNPPFRAADDFVLHARALGAVKVAMLLRLCWLEGEKRRKRVFEHHPPARVWVFSRRPTLWNGSDPDARATGGAIAYAWFVWDHTSAVRPPALGWLSP